MTQVYLGNDKYEVYFNSGNMIIMSKEEIDELVNDSDSVAELVDDLDNANDDKNRLEKLLGEIHDKVEEYRNTPHAQKIDADSLILDINVITETELC